MKVFVTGAAGFIGQALMDDLIKHGHSVLGLARSDKSAEIITNAGGEVHRGDLDDLENLKKAAATADGAIHLAFEPDFANFRRSIEKDKAAIEALAEGMSGTDNPLVYASGSLLMPDGQVSTEDTPPERETHFAMRAESEDKVAEVSKTKGVRGSTVRLAPIVHGQPGDRGFLILLHGVGKKNGFLTYIDQGTNRWPSVGRSDAATLFRLALEKGRAGGVYNATAETAVKFKDIMEAVGRKTGLPVVSKSKEDAQEAIGFFAVPIAFDRPVSSEKTQKELGWKPTAPGILADIEESYNF